MGKARRVAFRKAVASEALDLLEHALGEAEGVAAADHAADQLVPVHRHALSVLEGGHGPVQLVGLAGGEVDGDNGHPHGLLLKERYAQSAAEHLIQFIFGSMIPSPRPSMCSFGRQMEGREAGD